MDIYETITQSFILKIWVEDASDKKTKGYWRGHITHVPSGNKRYVQTLGDIFFFISPYIENIGIKLPIRWRIAKLIREIGKQNSKSQDKVKLN